MYPENWPRYPTCGDFALDGHITCGRLQCNEAETRNDWMADQIAEPKHPTEGDFEREGDRRGS